MKKEKSKIKNLKMKRKDKKLIYYFFKTYFYDLNFHAPIIDIIANTGINIAIKITLS